MSKTRLLFIILASTTIISVFLLSILGKRLSPILARYVNAEAKRFASNIVNTSVNDIVEEGITDDLFQIGCIGLLKAIDNFDLSHEVKFSTYAVPMILGEVRRYIRDNNSIRVSRSLKDIAYKTLRLKEKYLQENGEEASIEYIAKELDLSECEIVNALDSLKEPVSMFEPVYNDGGDTIYLCDQIEDKSTSSKDFSNHIAIEEAMNTLEEREKQILDKRFIIGKTQMEIADEIGISQAQVSRLEKRAIKQLKKVLK